MNTPLLNILILLAIIYLIFLIIDKFGMYILAILGASLLFLATPIIIHIVIMAFTFIGTIAAKPYYWITGITLTIPWWVVMVMLVLTIGPMFLFINGPKEVGFR